jgi:hypothetical protein
MRTTVARASFLIRLRVQSDGTWAGQVEHIPTGQKQTFRDPQQLLERLAAMIAGPAPDADVPEAP